jgi:hypothetical protein
MRETRDVYATVIVGRLSDARDVLARRVAVAAA